MEVARSEREATQNTECNRGENLIIGFPGIMNSQLAEREGGGMMMRMDNRLEKVQLDEQLCPHFGWEGAVVRAKPQSLQQCLLKRHPQAKLSCGRPTLDGRFSAGAREDSAHTLFVCTPPLVRPFHQAHDLLSDTHQRPCQGLRQLEHTTLFEAMVLLAHPAHHPKSTTWREIPIQSRSRSI